MSKHVHIHIRRARKANDAGWDESKHKRDHGKFATTSGDASHHRTAAEMHIKAMKALPGGDRHPHSGPHLAAARAHQRAAMSLEEAARGSAPQYHLSDAQMHAQNAKAHEARIKGAAGGEKSSTQKRQEMLREMGSPRYSGRKI